MDVKLSYEIEGNSGNSWLDYLVVSQTLPLIHSTQLTFRNALVNNYNSLLYQINSESEAPIIWDITDPLVPKKINYNKNGNLVQFTDEGKEITTYVIFDSKSEIISSPSFVSEVANQNIHGLPIYDFIIISHPDFISSSETLADYHRQNDNMSVLVVTTGEVYNEFSSGLPDVAAIRNMARMFYKQKTASDSLRYLLLMGDGHYKNYNPENSTKSFIPTYQSKDSESEGSYTSDDFFVLLDDHEGEAYGSIDIGIGRIPCRSIDEADLVGDKTIKYNTAETMGDWRNVIAFIADDEDGEEHMENTEDIIDIVNEKYPGFYTDKIYFDAFQQIETSGGDKYPDVTDAINRRVEEGALILNYIGHANEISLGHEDVLGMSDINSWSNKNKLPVFVTATCEFSRFDDDITTAGEQILLNPAGGGVALFSTTRVVYSNANFILSKNFYNSVFEQDQEGENFRMGDIMRMAKNKTGGDNKRSFALLGDPALQLAFPKYKIETNSINGAELRDTLVVVADTILGFIIKDTITTTVDTVTIGALDKVTIKSQVVDHLGNLLSNYNGNVTAVVYDKETNVKTLDNDNEGEFEYKAQNNIIFKGTSTVENGEFEFNFIVPKDITYNIDKGKVFYYTTNYIEDGNGSSNQFNIGGSSKDPFLDDDAPVVDLYLNNRNFRSNDKVSSSILFYADLYDESGINTVGTGIGHDIVAILDNDYSNPIVLNDYYISRLNSYQNGQVLYPINNLEPGEHTISIKVWDIQNNSTVAEITFYVEEGFEITAVHNVPNPVEFETVFEIAHNLPGKSFITTIEIYNLRGLLIYKIEDNTSSYETLNASVRWDISDSYYPINNEKILVYRVTMENQQGLSATGAGKLLLTKNN
jgi:hypothetical protein